MLRFIRLSLVFASLFFGVLFVSRVEAQLFEYSDATGHRNQVDFGVYAPSFSERPWPGRSLGVGNSAGGVLNGATGRSQLSFDSDIAGGLTIGLGDASQCSLGTSTIVVFLDTVEGGVARTDFLSSDGSIPGRAVAAPNLVFAPGFEADFAITVQSDFTLTRAILWDLRSGRATVVRDLNAQAECQSTGSFVADGFSVDDLGIALGDPIDYLGTLVLTDGRRHSEFHGTGDRFSGIISTPTFLAANEFARFNTVGSVVINEVDSDQGPLDVSEFVELAGPPGLDLRNCSVVFSNGSSDMTYRAISLTGAIDSTGFYVIGNVGAADQPLPGSSDLIQDGPDAISLHGTAEFDTGMTLASLHSIADAVVHDTNDPDDAGLLSFFTPGHPQVNEGEGSDSAGDSIQRCGDGGPRFATERFSPGPRAPAPRTIATSAAVESSTPVKAAMMAAPMAPQSAVARPIASSRVAPRSVRRPGPTPATPTTFATAWANALRPSRTMLSSAAVPRGNAMFPKPVRVRASVAPQTPSRLREVPAGRLSRIPATQRTPAMAPEAASTTLSRRGTFAVPPEAYADFRSSATVRANFVLRTFTEEATSCAEVPRAPAIPQRTAPAWPLLALGMS